MTDLRPLSEDEITIALLLANLPEPIQIRALPRMGQRHHLLRFENGGQSIIEQVPNTFNGGVDHLLTLFHLAKETPALGLQKTGHLLNEGLAGVAWVYPKPNGRNALHLPAVESVPLLGSALAGIHQHTQQERGSLPTGETFICRSHSWSEERALLARKLASRAAHDVPLFGSLVTRLVGEVCQHAEALDSPSAATIVHGALGPQNVWLDASGEPTHITGWHRACFGDIEQDWVPFVFTPHLHLFFNGYGTDIVSSTMEDEHSWGRLRAHVAVFLLQRICRLGELTLGVSRCQRMEDLYQITHLFLQPGWLKSRIDASLHATSTPELPQTAPKRVICRWILEALVIRSHQEQSPFILGALGTLQLAEHHTEYQSQLLSIAHRACQRLSKVGQGVTLLGTCDVAETLKKMGRLVLEDLETAERTWGQAAAAYGLLSRAIVQMGGAVEVHLVVAFEEHMRLLLQGRRRMTQQMSSPEKKMTHKQEVVHALLCLGAMTSLQEQLGSDYTERVQNMRVQMEARLMGAVNRLELPGLVHTSGRPSFTSLLSRLCAAEPLSPSQWMLPALLSAYKGSEDFLERVIPAEALFVLFDVGYAHTERDVY